MIVEDILLRFIDATIVLKRSNPEHLYFLDTVLDKKYVRVSNEAITENGFVTTVYTKMSIGRYLTKYYARLSPNEITHYCEKYKSLFSLDSTKFNILEGNDIYYAYNRKNYVPGYHCTLQHSCMRYKKCQDEKYFDIYKDHAKVLVLTPKNGKRILGRAILWKYKNTYLMDRVYYADNYMYYLFLEYAKEHKFYILESNNYITGGYIANILSPKDDYSRPVQLDIKIKLDKDYESYPFMDNVCYIKNQWLSSIPSDNCFIAHSTNGQLYYNI